MRQLSMINANQLTEDDLKFIHFTGFVDDNDLAAIYSGALVLFFPLSTKDLDFPY